MSMEDKPLQRVLIDLDLRDPSRQVIGGNPMDFDQIPTERVHSFIAPDRVITIFAHQGEGQLVANLLEARPDIKGWIMHYAEHYWPQGVESFAMQAISEESAEGILDIDNEDRS